MKLASEQVFGAVIESFGASLQIRGHFRRTREAYLDTARRFAAFCEVQRFPADLVDIRRVHVEAFIRDQLVRFAPSTAATRFRYLQQFMRFAVGSGAIAVSPMAGMSAPKAELEAVEVLTEAELGALLDACDGSTFEDLRDRAIIGLFIDAGLTRSEMAGIALDDLSHDGHEVLVAGARRRVRTIALGVDAAAAMDRYVRERRSHPRRGDPAMWLGLRGQFTASGIAQMLQRRAVAADVADLSVHRFRHTVATRRARSGPS